MSGEVERVCRGCTIDDREPHTCEPPSGKLTYDETEALADAFAAANRSEFLDFTTNGVIPPDDPDLPILRAVERILAAQVASAAAEGWALGHDAACPQGAVCSAHQPLRAALSVPTEAEGTS